MPLPTSALTHPKMFTRLGVFRSEQLEEYHFQHMVGLDALLVYNTRQGRSTLSELIGILN